MHVEIRARQWNGTADVDPSSNSYKIPSLALPPLPSNAWARASLLNRQVPELKG